MDSVERDQRSKYGFSERGDKLWNRDSGEKRKKGGPSEKPPHTIRADSKNDVTEDQNDRFIEPDINQEQAEKERKNREKVKEEEKKKREK